MNERINESLSALVDGQCDELELRRVLNELEQNAECREKWLRYQMMSALMRDEAVATVDLSRGIMQAIDGEPMDEISSLMTTDASAQPLPNEPSDVAKRGWMSSVAVAASVTLAVLVGVRFYTDVNETATLAASTPSLPTNSVVAVPAPPAMDAQQLEQGQRMLQEYLLQHTEHAALNPGRGMMPFARVATFERAGDVQP